VLRSRLNLTSKYVLERQKLKRILETLHQEVNHGLQMKLRGGINTVVDVLETSTNTVTKSIEFS
jgi:uncharacterized FlaG/YvyC family protein